MSPRQKRLALVTVVTCVAALGTAAFAGRRHLQLEYWRWRAAEECAVESDCPEMPPLHLRLLLDAGQQGYPYLLNLLKNQNKQMLWRIAHVLNHESFETDFIEYLRGTDRLAALQYLFLLPFEIPNSWRNEGQDYKDPLWYRYWSGKDGVPLEPFEEGIAFLESALVPLGSTSRLLQERAVNALTAMIRPGEVRVPSSPLAARVVESLAHVASTDQDPAVRLHTLNRMVIRSEPEESWKLIDPNWTGSQIEDVIEEYPFPLPSLEEWKASSRPDPIERARGPLLALCHLDHPDALPILTRLMNDPEVQPTLKTILIERPRLGPLEMPHWIIQQVDGKPEVRIDPRR